MRASAEAIYHPVGTCRMGEDRDAVVDSKLRVRGIDNLRVIDSSLIPTVISGKNTNLPIMAMAEKAAELIAGSDPMFSPQWQEQSEPLPFIRTGYRLISISPARCRRSDAGVSKWQLQRRSAPSLDCPGSDDGSRAPLSFEDIRTLPQLSRRPCCSDCSIGG